MLLYFQCSENKSKDFLLTKLNKEDCEAMADLRDFTDYISGASTENL